MRITAPNGGLFAALIFTHARMPIAHGLRTTLKLDSRGELDNCCRYRHRDHCRSRCRAAQGVGRLLLESEASRRVNDNRR